MVCIYLIMKFISIGKDFSRAPIGRYKSDGAFSGEVFREDILKPALDSYQVIEIKIDDVEGYGSSFLDEAFGGLIRVHSFTKEELLNRIQIKYELPEFEVYQKLITKYIKQEK